MAVNIKGQAIQSMLSEQGVLSLYLSELALPPPADDDVIVRIEAAPINPADRLVMFSAANPLDFQPSGTGEISATVSPAALKAMASRVGKVMALGNEGAGTVVAAGRLAKEYLGKTVALRDGMFAQYRRVKAAECLILPPGMTARQGAAASINPLTALCMIDTLRREGHRALVHTAAASNLGQMLQRLCQQEGIPLINIVRRAEQVAMLREAGAAYVLDSSSAHFESDLTAALCETGATLAFDAIGGGTLTSTILSAMEQAQRKNLPFSRYGSAVHKQVYTSGMLDLSAKIIQGDFGAAWGVGGWLMSLHMQKIGTEQANLLKARVVSELTTTFASDYAAEISLADALNPAFIAAYSRAATGEKYLIAPWKNDAGADNPLS